MGLVEELAIACDGKKHLKYVEFKKIDLKNDEAGLYDIIRNVSSMCLEIHEDRAEFGPMMALDGKRTYSIEDIDSRTITQLRKALELEMPILIDGRINDLLWMIEKDYRCAKQAAIDYIKLFEEHKDAELWTTGIEYLRRALIISKQINDTKLVNFAVEQGRKYLEELDGNDKSFCTISLVELLLDFKFEDKELILECLNKLESNTESDYHRIKQIYKQKMRCVAAKQRRIEQENLVRNYEQEANRLVSIGTFQSIVQAISCLEETVKILVELGDTAERVRVHKKLVDIQGKVPNMIPIHKIGYDLTNWNKYCENMFEGLSFKEAIIRMGYIVPFYNYEEEREKLIKNGTGYIFSDIFPVVKVNCHGQTTCRLDSLNKSDEKSILSHLYSEYQKKEERFGMLAVSMLSAFREKYVFSIDELDFLVNDNAIVPIGREGIIRSAIYMVLKGYYYEAIHILAPQVENIFREIACESGGLTVKIEKEVVTEEISLSSIFGLDELKDCYDNNLLFLFKGLLSEKTGSNIRNEVAHGIMSYKAAMTGARVYFCCAVIKWLTWTSRECMDIIENKQELFKLPQKEGNLVKLINKDNVQISE